jgi:hypothetical protein
LTPICILFSLHKPHQQQQQQQRGLAKKRKDVYRETDGPSCDVMIIVETADMFLFGLVVLHYLFVWTLQRWHHNHDIDASVARHSCTEAPAGAAESSARI